MSTSENIKCAKLKEALSKRILLGEFPFNARFPGVHELLAEYGVSYVTAVKALKLLEDEGYLRCRRGVGYFTIYNGIIQSPQGKRLNLVLHEECWKHNSAHLETELSRFRDAGWKIEVVPLKSMDIHDASEYINSPDAYTMIYCLSADWSRFNATFTQVRNRVLVLGKLSGSPQITSVVCDESETVRQILEFLNAQGRTRPGIFCGKNENELEMYRLAYWRMALQRSNIPMEWIQTHIFPLTTEQYGVLESLDKDMRKQMSDALKAHCKELDSIVVPYSRKLFQDSCRCVGIDAPAEILPVFISSPRWLNDEKNSFPVLDHNITAHFETALNILEYRRTTGQKEPGSWYFCPPLGVKTFE